MLGDNMYGAERPQDFVQKFEKPYKPLLDAGVKFYASLGNHDDPNQRFYKPFNMDGERYYTYTKGPVRFFVLDSNYMDENSSTGSSGNSRRATSRGRSPTSITRCIHRARVTDRKSICAR